MATSKSSTPKKKRAAPKQKIDVPDVTENTVVPVEGTTYKKHFFITVAIAVVLLILVLFFWFSRPKPVIVGDGSHVELQKAYNDLLKVSGEQRAKDSVEKIESKKKEIYWHNIAVDQQNELLSNLKLYIENEKKYRAINGRVKPIHDLDSLRAAIQPKW